MSQEKEKEGALSDVNNNIFNGSIALLAVCLTIISLFQMSDKRVGLIVDEFLGASSVLFTAAMYLSYLSIRKNHVLKYHRWADWVFVVGLISMFVAGVLLIYEL